MELLVFGLNHRTAPAEIRERWAFSRERSLLALGRLRETSTPSEHLILSTCNRTEFYSHVPLASSPFGDTDDPHKQCRSLASFYFDDDPVDNEDLGYFYFHRQQAAVEHLFRVAGGLDSMIVGESEILGQIKEAMAVAREGNAAGKLFQRLFPEALKVGKRVRTATDISKGCITPGQAALQLADEVLGDSKTGEHGDSGDGDSGDGDSGDGDSKLDGDSRLSGLRGSRALLIGSGKVATIAARSLLDRELSNFTIVNRTPEHARDLLAQMSGKLDDGSPRIGKTARWEDLAEEAAHADVIISSTASKQPVLSRDMISHAQEARGGAPLAIIDLAIPRDVEAEAGEIEGVHLFNIDALNRVVCKNVEKRHEHVEHAERIVREQLSVFFGRLKFLEIEPVIRHLIERFEDIRLGELQSSLDQFPPELHETVDEMTRRLVSKMIHFPIERLKAIRDMKGIGEAETQFLRRLFLSDR